MSAQRKKTVEDIDVAGKDVLVRVDFNVPMKQGTSEISDDSRIRAAIPTIEYLRERGARVILASHFGRPKGRVVDEMRLRPTRERLSELLGDEVIDADGPSGNAPHEAIRSLPEGGVAMLENLRFDPREEENDPEFARELASLADIYVNDAFGAAHRAHASTAGVAAYIPAVAGFLMAREIEMLGAALQAPERPVLAIIGGAKVADKIAVLENLSTRVDVLLIGGGMVSAFLQAEGHAGGARADAADVDAARSLLEKSKARVIIPKDVVTAPEFSEDAPFQVVSADAVPEGALVLDIGPEAAREYAAEISSAKTILWNGPMGVFEWKNYSQGTRAVAEAIAANSGATTVVGGGSTAEAVGALGLRDRVTHVSTGGGASLEFLEGKALPGVEALLDADA